MWFKPFFKSKAVEKDLQKTLQVSRLPGRTEIFARLDWFPRRRVLITNVFPLFRLVVWTGVIGFVLSEVIKPELKILVAISATAGVAFFATDSRVPYGHLIWHLFVIAGTTCHYFLVLWYAA
jgi:predicted membrane channel-forming protein YqfA (hemolysin III family)